MNVSAFRALQNAENYEKASCGFQAKDGTRFNGINEIFLSSIPAESRIKRKEIPLCDSPAVPQFSPEDHCARGYAALPGQIIYRKNTFLDRFYFEPIFPRETKTGKFIFLDPNLSESLERKPVSLTVGKCGNLQDYDEQVHRLDMQAFATSHVKRKDFAIDIIKCQQYL
jgi:hypothetical protein